MRKCPIAPLHAPRRTERTESRPQPNLNRKSRRFPQLLKPFSLSARAFRRLFRRRALSAQTFRRLLERRTLSARRLRRLRQVCALRARRRRSLRQVRALKQRRLQTLRRLRLLSSCRRQRLRQVRALCARRLRSLKGWFVANAFTLPFRGNYSEKGDRMRFILEGRATGTALPRRTDFLIIPESQRLTKQTMSSASLQTPPFG
jgi:hypothetical protein